MLESECISKWLPSVWSQHCYRPTALFLFACLLSYQAVQKAIFLWLFHASQNLSIAKLWIPSSGRFQTETTFNCRAYECSFSTFCGMLLAFHIMRHKKLLKSPTDTKLIYADNSRDVCMYGDFRRKGNFVARKYYVLMACFLP